MDRGEKEILLVLDDIISKSSVRSEIDVVISFHTVSDSELIEERPDPENTRLTLQRRYIANVKD